MIPLYKSNYKYYLPINAMAFSYAHGGAQGEPGGVIILDNDGKFFHFNCIYGDLLEDEILEIFPPLKEVANDSIPENYGCKYLGCGNSLFVNKAILPDFEEKTKALEIPDQLYSKWENIILDIVKKLKKNN